MTADQLLPLWILLGLGAFFAVLVPALLKLRKSTLGQNLRITADEVWAQRADGPWDRGDLLYGTWQDFSATERGMVVRDGDDREIGQIRFRTGRRQGWVAIDTADASFAGDVQPTLLQTVALHRANEAAAPCCRFTRSAGGAFRFASESLGTLEGGRGKGWMRPRYAYTLEGEHVGAGWRIGAWLDRGRALVLPRRLPLFLRLFVLAMEGERA